MGRLVAGRWTNQRYEGSATGGRFVREPSRFRNWVTPDGSAGLSGTGGFPAEAGRYHLYVSLACPWAHRALIFRKLKRLEDMVSMSVVNPYMGPEGWTFMPGPGVVGDDVNHAARLYEIYVKARPDYSGRVTVPVLWDKKRQTIVNNESSEIIRMFNSAFDYLGAAPGDYYPPALRAEIDALNEQIYENVNDGVYRAGFATTQEAYEEAVRGVFDTLDALEQRLSRQRYVTGSRITEADWRLFTTLVRFDPVYYGHFKCNVRRLIDYPCLFGYVRELYQTPGVAETVDISHIKIHYYRSHASINPNQIIPLGPQIDYSAAHGRDRLVTGSFAVL
jgi:putative glutathione S-transferase